MEATAPLAAHNKAARGPLVPREHGAWAMLLIPLVVSLAAAGRWGLEGPLFLGTCLAIYTARQPINMLVRSLQEPGDEAKGRPLFWLGVYAVLALAFGLPLLFYYGRWLLLPWAAIFMAFTAAHFYLRQRRQDRTIPGELVTIAGLALTAPGAYYVARGLEPTAAYLWVLTTLYSSASIFYVRMKMKHRSLRRPAKDVMERLSLGRNSIIYQGVLVLVLALAVAWGQVPPFVPIAFAPLLAKVTYAVLAGDHLVNIKKVGWIEVAHSVAFTFLLIGAYLVGPRP